MSDSGASRRDLKAAAPRWLYFLLFAISGFAGLIYESIWSHYLKLFLGHAAYAQSLVLIIFMGGMAVGAWLASRVSTRWRSLLLVYAIVEAIIGVAGLLFHPLFTALIDAFYVSVLPGIGSPLLGNALKFGAAALLILPQSVLLGMTFPVMSAGILRRFPDTPGGSIAMLYFTNSIGAAIGVLASGFWLIGAVGLPGTIAAAGMVNLLLAIFVFVLVRLDPVTPVVPDQPDRSGQGLSLLARRFLVAAFITGAASFIYEIGWIRMLSLVLGSTTHSFELMLSAFITGLAFGGLWIRRRIDRIDAPVRFSGYVQLLMGVLALLTLPVYAQTFGWMEWLLGALDDTDGGYTAFSLASHAIALAVMLPTTFMAGMTLPLFTYVLIDRGDGERSIGRVYAANTVGAIAGVLFAVHIGMPFLGLKNLIIVGGLLDIGLGLYLLNVSEDAGRVRTLLARGAVASGIVIVFVVVGIQLDQRLLTSGVYRLGTTQTMAESEVRYYRDGKTATVSLSRLPNGWLSLSTNGKSDAAIQMEPGKDYASDEVTMTLLGSLAVAYKPDAKSAAVIGMGSGMTTHTLLAKESIERVDTVEIEPSIIEASRQFGSFVARAHDDPRSRLRVEDAKTFFSLQNERYDIITAEPSNPWVSGVASLFSSEFYANVRRHLTDDGVFLQWIQLYEFDNDLALSILRALAENFADFTIYMADDGNILLLARSNGRLGDPDWTALFDTPLAGALQRIGIGGSDDLLIRKLTSASNLRTFLQFQIVPANSDYFPYVDLNAGKARFAASRADLFDAWTHAPLPMLEMLNGDRLDFSAISMSPYLLRSSLVSEADGVYRRLVEGETRAEIRDPALGYAADWMSLGLGSCLELFDAKRWLPAAHQLLRASLPNLTAERASRLVETLEARHCEGIRPTEVDAWMALYRAIAVRDGQATAAAAATLLRATTSDPATLDFLFSAAVLGEVSAGRPAQALEIWEKLGVGRIPNEQVSPRLRLLLSIAVGAVQQP